MSMSNIDWAGTDLFRGNTTYCGENSTSMACFW